MEVETNALKDWAIQNKRKSFGVILLASIFLVLGLALWGPLSHYFLIKQMIDNLREKIILTKSLNLERHFLFDDANSKIILYKKESQSESEIRAVAIWLSYYLSQCGVWQFNFTEESKAPIGAQGRPIFSIMAHLYYSQVLCVLDCFCRYSIDKKLRVMKLGQENNDPRLTLKLEVES